MTKLKVPLLILFTMILLIIGASLPQIAAAVQDSATVNNSGYSEMESLKLDFSQERQWMPILGKLALIRDGSFYGISTEETVMSEDEVKLAVEEGLSLYYQAELIPYNWNDVKYVADPHLVYASSNTENYCILWVVSIAWPDDEHMLSLYVDDETGLILYLHYETIQALDVYTAQGYLDAFSNAYFESTGISAILVNPEGYGAEFVDYDDSGLNAGGDLSYCHTIYHPDYGYITFEFWIYTNGYYVLIREK